ncbi:MAG TPA: hypothetical protein VN721_12995 [Flavipsychrobacter sp.]|nr:hypothetical protein [Flavipsychrobacter sp.]
MKYIKLLFAFLLFSVCSFAQTSTSNGAPEDSLRVPNIRAEVIDATKNPGSLHSTEFVLSISILSFGLLVIILEVYLAYNKVINPSQIWKCIIVTLVIISSLVLITAGYSNNQISGISGILGSIAGYLLAKNSSEDEKG